MQVGSIVILVGRGKCLTFDINICEEYLLLLLSSQLTCA